MSLAFVPRKVAKSAQHPRIQGARHTVKHASSSELSSKPPAVELEAESNISESVTATRGSQKGLPSKCTQNDKELATLVLLNELPRLYVGLIRIQYRAELYKTLLLTICVWEEVISFDYLFRYSALLSNTDFSASLELDVVKASKASFGDFLEIRMLVSAPSSSGWYGNNSKADSIGGYEVRRKDWERILRLCREYTREEWERNTVYVENIPPQYRTVPSIAHFMNSLLSSSTVPLISQSFDRIQNIHLLSHHQDEPGDQPKCKGFALVLLMHKDDVQNILHAWPWDRNHFSGRRLTSTISSDTGATLEAKKYGVRALGKDRWDELKEEYIAYRGDLLNEFSLSQEAQAGGPQRGDVPITPGHISDISMTEPISTEQAPTVASKMKFDSSSLYPPDCLVLVRNVHPETNKTTLRTIFSAAFNQVESKQAQDGLDYVDFNKGIDSCYLRFVTPSHAGRLVHYFTQNAIVQTHGLGDASTFMQSTQEARNKAIAVEMVQGKREQLYWEKVPEKVRKRAVQRCLELDNYRDGGLDLGDGIALPMNERKPNSRRRKRKDECD